MNIASQAEISRAHAGGKERGGFIELMRRGGTQNRARGGEGSLFAIKSVQSLPQGERPKSRGRNKKEKTRGKNKKKKKQV